MNRNPKRSPIEVRREQVEAAIAKLKSPKGVRTRRDFKTDNLYAVWKDKYDKRLYESSEELAILDNPAEYNEVPLAVAAEEFGLTLQQLRDIVDDELIETSFEGEYRMGARITRDELARAIEADPQELLRIARQPVEEIYEETIRQLHVGDVATAELLFDRLERNCSWESYQYETAARIGLKLLKGDLDGIDDELEFRYHNTIEIAARLKEIRRVVQGVKAADHPSAIAREQILAVADGAKLEPAKDAPYRFSKEPMSAMDESQRHAMFLALVTMESIRKHKFEKSLRSSRSYLPPERQDELEGVIRDAIYTALEAERTYHDSPTSQLFVDRYVKLFPKRWAAAESTVLLPASRSNK